MSVSSERPLSTGQPSFTTRPHSPASTSLCATPWSSLPANTVASWPDQTVLSLGCGTGLAERHLIDQFHVPYAQLWARMFRLP
ncbi:MAG: hypothetical protein IPN20_00420 [Haliscomenobacter sp.]|nr:hypothetical protein [Haliscomenobacter sp.]